MFYGLKTNDLQPLKKKDMVERYKELKASNAVPRKYKKWLADEECELQQLKEPIKIKGTALGRYKAKKKEDQLKDVLSQLTEWGVNKTVLEAVKVEAAGIPPLEPTSSLKSLNFEVCLKNYILFCLKSKKNYNQYMSPY